jgi:hypothetical protein
LGNRLKNVLQIIFANFDFINKIIDDQIKENNNKENLYIIKIENYVSPNPKDNLEEIFICLNQLIVLQINKKSIV